MKEYQKNLMEKTKTIYAIYGAGGCGRGLIQFVYQNFFTKFTRIIFVDDKLKNKEINGYKVISYNLFKKLDNKKKFLLIGVSNVKIRKQLSQKIKRDGINTFSLFSNQSIVFEKNNIGEGSSISPFVTITSNVKIGKFFHINLYSYVEHDCDIGNFVTFAPGVKCNGNVTIEDNVYIGSGAIIKNGLPEKKIIIGKNSIIGAGAVITKNIPKNSIIIGNPARKLLKKL